MACWCYWLFGIWAAALLVFFSTVAGSSSQVLLGVGGVTVGCYLFGLFPKFAPFFPTRLMEGISLLQGVKVPEDFYASMAAAGGMAALCLAAGVVCFEKKRL